MTFKSILTLPLMLLSLLALTGCALLPQTDKAKTEAALPAMQTAYDYVLLNSQTQQPVTLLQLTQQLKTVDVIFIGEFHGNHASHLLQAQLQSLLYQQNPKQVLSMEQFNRDQQSILERYLDDEVGETYLINEAPAWENYRASYRPLVEFAKQRFLPVIAANAPADTVRCIGRQGADYITKLSAEEKTLIASSPFTEIDNYREMFNDYLQGGRHLDPAKAERSYLAQLMRDNTMAESILKALQNYPDHQLIHTNGAFHSNHGLGTVAALQKLKPNLNIKVISPIYTESPQQPKVEADDYLAGDYVYLIQPQPEKYRQATYRKQAFQNMFKRADAKSCK